MASRDPRRLYRVLAYFPGPAEFDSLGQSLHHRGNSRSNVKEIGTKFGLCNYQPAFHPSLSLSLSPFFFSISLRLLFLRIFVFSFADSLHEFVDVFAFIGISRTGIRKSMRFGWSILDWQWEREREKGVEREVGWTGITCDLFERNYRILIKQGRGREEGGGFVWITVRTLKVGGHQIAVIFLPFRFFRAKTIRGNLDTLLRLFQFLGGLL